MIQKIEDFFKGTKFTDWEVDTENEKEGSQGVAVYPIRRMSSLDIKRVEENAILKVIKSISKTKLVVDDQFKNMQKEIINMQKVSSNYVVPYLDFDLIKPYKDNKTGTWISRVLILMKEYTPINEIKLSKDETIDLGLDVLRGLKALRKVDLFHRDIKPSNLFKNHDAYLLGDLGIARDRSDATYKTRNAGTLYYMAPEQLKEKYDYRVDIYSLGLTMYELLNGNYPFVGYEGIDTVEKANFERLKPSNAINIPKIKNCDEELNRIVLKAMAYDVEDRYQSVDDFYKDLNEYKSYMVVKSSTHYADKFTSAPQVIMNKKYERIDEFTITFGLYHQQNASHKEPLEWYIIQDDGKYLTLLSKNIIEYWAFHKNTIDNHQVITWDISHVNETLNNFYKKLEILSRDLQRVKLATPNTIVLASKGIRKREISGGNSTESKIWLPSKEELMEIELSHPDWLKAKPTDYVKMKAKNDCSYWTRSSGRFNEYTCYVDSEGRIQEGGKLCTNKCGVRICVKIKK